MPRLGIGIGKSEHSNFERALEGAAPPSFGFGRKNPAASNISWDSNSTTPYALMLIGLQARQPTLEIAAGGEDGGARFAGPQLGTGRLLEHRQPARVVGVRFPSSGAP